MDRIAARRILIVEDNALIGEHIADLVHRAGGVPLGPLCTGEEARDALDCRALAFDAAILDVHLDEPTDALADRLEREGLPFIFATGNRAHIPSRHRDRPVCEKPFTAQGLLEALRHAFGAEAAEPEAATPPPAQIIPLPSARG
jgi:DNA-binding NtrC family response regulator